MAQKQTETPVIAPCLGCGAPLTYTLVTGDGAPELLPPMATAYANGHICGSCARAVADVLDACGRGVASVEIEIGGHS